MPGSKSSELVNCRISNKYSAFLKQQKDKRLFLETLIADFMAGRLSLTAARYSLALRDKEKRVKEEEERKSA
jgi:hypothetical protein